MTTPQPIVLHGYADLIAQVRARVHAIGAPINAVEAYIGLTSGHLGKILGPAEVKQLGMALAWPVLEKLGLRLALVQHLDIAATIDEMDTFHRPRKEQCRTMARVLRKRLSPDMITAAAQHNGALGRGIPKVFRIGKKRLRAKQQKAARARWA